MAYLELCVVTDDPCLTQTLKSPPIYHEPNYNRFLLSLAGIFWLQIEPLTQLPRELRERENKIETLTKSNGEAWNEAAGHWPGDRVNPGKPGRLCFAGRIVG